MIVKHLWHVAVDKNSLWVKSINTYKLKGKKVWELNEDSNDSWGWKNVLRMRVVVKKHMIVKLGDGNNTSMWFDSWSPIGALSEFITYRDLYDVRLNAKMTVKEFVVDEEGRWPEEWYSKFPIVTQIQEIEIDSDKNDRYVWKSNDGTICNFSIRQTYRDLCEVGEIAIWHKLVWFSQNVPKHAFILWLAVQEKLPTQDKIRKWGNYDLMVCLLCYSDSDSHDHLFFKCPYSSLLWSRVLHKLKMTDTWSSWGDVIGSFAGCYNGNSIRRLCLATCVNLVWQE